MNRLLTALLALTLVACSTPPIAPAPVVVTNTTYVVKIPPAELMALPPPVPNVDLSTATQADAAKWIIGVFGNEKKCEAQLQGIARFLSTQETQLNAPIVPVPVK